ncbi:chemotaxis protein CheB [Actinoplanes sp. L3-i22]|uniref:chemotaxis protein CheB n=1 Tax=Actinoplanes sp. L3-i22 TaxID=2836373 RepID=UPI001C79A73D|nr:chemotaxis protein CheB [Actinoplanes sp. L3-i22]BCY11159.1 chemotaxis protein CheB [Actinoplanes sp. L3-i22]
MTGRDLIVAGASAGGVEALRAMVAGLPADLPAAVLVVLHLPRASPSALPRILTRAGPLPAVTAVDGEVVHAGRIYVAPADRHLMLIDGRIRLSHGPAENGHRPAIDPLFRSAARARGGRVVAVVLSGTRDDGAAGAEVVAAQGGLVVVQDPADAVFASMPEAAVTRVPSAYVRSADVIGKLLGELCAAEAGDGERPVGALLAAEVSIGADAGPTTDRIPGEPAGFGCPTCGGALFTLTPESVALEPLPHFRCRVGHAWSPESLLDEQAVATEGALWLALRALEEKAALSTRMAEGAAGRSYGERFRGMADDAHVAAGLIRALLARLADSSATHLE